MALSESDGRLAPDGTLTRRRFLEAAAGAGVAGAALLARPGWVPAAPTARRLEHLVVCMNENRSFDHYFGYAPWIGGHGVVVAARAV